MLVRPNLPIDILKHIETFLVQYNPEVHTLSWVIKKNSTEGLRFLCEKNTEPIQHFAGFAIYLASGYGKLDMLNWLITRYGPVYESVFLRNLMDTPAAYGYLHIIQYLNTYNYSASTEAMDGSAGNGHFNVVKFLHDNRTEGCTQLAFDGAAENGHYHVMEWLYKNRTGRVSDEGMETAICNGHIEVVRFLLYTRDNSFYNFSESINRVAEIGDLAMIKLLHLYHVRGFTRYTMHLAAISGHFELVDWLHKNRSEGCLYKTMDDVAYTGNLRIVKWLHHNRTEGCTDDALCYAASKGDMPMVVWLRENRRECNIEHAIYQASRSKKLEVFKYLKQFQTKVLV